MGTIALWEDYNAKQLAEQTTTLVTVTCRCGLPFAIPKALNDWALGEGRRKQTIYCPLGHGWVYAGQSAEEKLRDRLQRANDRAGRLAAERDQLKSSLHGQTAAKTRFKNQRDNLRARAAAGVCPCCNRSFKQLRRHMQSKHPEYPGES